MSWLLERGLLWEWGMFKGRGALRVREGVIGV